MKPTIHLLAFALLFLGVLSLSVVPNAQGAKKKNKDKGEGETVFDFTEQNPGEVRSGSR